MAEKKKVLVPFALKAVKDRIAKLQQDELVATRQIKDLALTRSSIRGGIIELNRLISNDKTK